MSEKRHPIEVALAIRNKIPDEGLRQELSMLISDFAYKAPEQHPECFRLLSIFLWNRNVTTSPLKDRWQVEVAAILTGKTVDEIMEIEGRLAKGHEE